MANTIDLWEINKLINKKFYIPTYQRGYRWDGQQVTDLLNDLYEFKNSANTSNGEFYCLQPIVVMKNGEKYDVIDGQQRLTTILIILKYLNRRTYTIDYATREGSESFLDNINERAKDDIVKKNIDFFFMKNAFHTVKNWFETTMEEKEEYSLDTEMTTYLLKYCKVIWYEVEGVDAESIFTRLNIGKIPLTNAELIKALLLRESNYTSAGDIAYLRKLEIANEWDLIENTLRDDRVWFFINHPYVKQPEVRIEYIFDSICFKKKTQGEFATFYVFNDRLKDSSVDDIWKEVKEYFQIIMEWYNNQELYHLIGFITTKKLSSLDDLIYYYNAHSYTKSQFLNEVKGIIKRRMKRIGEIGELDYNDDKPDDISTVLLLFNIITVMQKSNAYSRFRFDEYQKNEWSLEHIHAQNAEGILNSTESMLAWIDEHILSFSTFIDDKRSKEYSQIVEMLKNFDRKNVSKDSFSKLFDEISKKIEPDYGIDLDNISNLALLDRNANSSLSNSFFDVKRRKIVEKDRNGEFIPVCTRNVFLKYYSEDASQIHYWSQKDRADYLKSIKEALSEYLQEE